MEWYTAVIVFLSVLVVGSLVFIVNMVGIIRDLRIENRKLEIDLSHK